MQFILNNGQQFDIIKDELNRTIMILNQDRNWGLRIDNNGEVYKITWRNKSGIWEGYHLTSLDLEE